MPAHRRIADVFAANQTELRDRIASLKLQSDLVDRSHDEMSELAVKVFELSQTLRQKSLTADYSVKRRIMESVFLNCRLDDATSCPTIRTSHCSPIALVGCRVRQPRSVQNLPGAHCRSLPRRPLADLELWLPLPSTGMLGLCVTRSCPPDRRSVPHFRPGDARPGCGPLPRVPPAQGRWPIS